MQTQPDKIEKKQQLSVTIPPTNKIDFMRIPFARVDGKSFPIVPKALIKGSFPPPDTKAPAMKLAPLVVRGNELDPIPVLMFEHERRESEGIVLVDLNKFPSPSKNSPIGQVIERPNAML